MAAWEITKKDLRLLARDRRALVTLVAFPLVFIAILGFSTGRLLGWRDENQQLKLAVVDEVNYEAAGVNEIYIDDAALKRKNARRVVDDVLDKLRRREGFRVQPVADRPTARRMLQHEEVNAAVFLGPDFFALADRLKLRDVLDPDSGNLADGLADLDIDVEGRTSVSTTTGIVRQLVLSDVVRVLVPYVACKDNLARLKIRSKCARYESLEDAGEPTEEAPPAVAQPTGTSRSEIVYQELVPGFTVMFVFFLVNIMGRSFIHERELGTLRRLRMAPVTRAGLLLGKTLPFFLISLVQTALLFLCGKVLFGMSWGPEPPMLVPVIVATSVAATGMGLLLATLVRTDSQVSAYGNFLVITMAGVSGCFMPRDWLPQLMQQLSLVTPHAWALTAYRELLTTDQPTLVRVFQSCGMLALFGAAFFALGWWRFRPEEA